MWAGSVVKPWPSRRAWVAMQALPEVEFNQGVGGVQFEFLPDELVRYGVVMPLIVHVVVDMDGNRLNVDVVPGLWRQRG